MNEPLNDDSVIYWDRISGNKFNVSLSSIMTLGTGFHRKTEIRLLGESRMMPAQFRTILYDRNYVVAKVANDFVRPLSRLPYNEVQAIFTDAWRLVKDEG